MKTRIEEHITDIIKPDCYICREPTDARTLVSTECCNALYHHACLLTSRIYNMRCPTCVQHYRENNTDPLIKRLSNRSMSTVEVHDLYSRIYLAPATAAGEGSRPAGPLLLRELDSSLRRSPLYCQVYGGFYPTDLFHGTFCGKSDFQFHWKAYTFDIFSELNWDHIVACGPSLLNMAYLGGCRMLGNTAPIQFTVYNSDYRIVRQKLVYLVDYLQNRLEDQPLISIDDNIVTLYFPGFARRITINLEYQSYRYNAVLMRYKKMLSQICYDGKELQTTVKCIVDTKLKKNADADIKIETDTMNAPPEIVLSYRDTIDSFRARTGIACLMPSDFFNVVLKEYTLVLYTVPDQLANSILQRILSSDQISKKITIDIRLSADDKDEKPGSPPGKDDKPGSPPGKDDKPGSPPNRPILLLEASDGEKIVYGQSGQPCAVYTVNAVHEFIMRNVYDRKTIIRKRRP